MLNTFTFYFKSTFEMQIPYLNFTVKKYFYLYLSENLYLSKILNIKHLLVFLLKF